MTQFIGNEYRNRATYLFDCYVLLVEGFDKILLPINDVDGSAVVDSSNIPSSEPAIAGECFACLYFVLPVAFCYTSASN